MPRTPRRILVGLPVIATDQLRNEWGGVPVEISFPRFCISALVPPVLPTERRIKNVHSAYYWVKFDGVIVRNPGLYGDKPQLEFTGMYNKFQIKYYTASPGGGGPCLKVYYPKVQPRLLDELNPFYISMFSIRNATQRRSAEVHREVDELLEVIGEP